MCLPLQFKGRGGVDGWGDEGVLDLIGIHETPI